MGLKEFEQLLEALTKFQAQMYDRASAYTRLILTVAYAGFFTVWAATSKYMGKSALLWSALLMILSVMAYALFEVTQMLFISMAALRLGKAIQEQPTNAQVALQNHGRWEAKNGKRFAGVWVVALLLSIPTGYAAACILVGSIVRRLLHP